MPDMPVPESRQEAAYIRAMSIRIDVIPNRHGPGARILREAL